MNLQEDARAIHAVAGGYTVAAPLFGFSARFDAEGVRLHGGGSAADDLQLTLAGVGRESGVEAVAPVAPVEAMGDGDRTRLEYRRAGLTEWWQTLPSGLEQGFDLEAPLAGTGLLTFVTRVDGAELVASDGDGVSLMDAAGRSWNITDPAAWDADGVDLPVRIDARDGLIWLTVDDAGARYPITVDPVISSPAATISGGVTNDFFGYSVAAAGDVNGDGYDDVIVGAPGTSSLTGSAYLFHGGMAGLSTSPSRTLTGASTGAEFGGAVAGVGDVNGDGYDDVAVGAGGASGGFGTVAVYHGSAAGLSTTAAVTYTGTTSTGGFGLVVAGGDLTGDGYSDLAVSAKDFGNTRGRVYLYLGSSAGLSTTAAVTLNGAADENQFGTSMAVLGDVSGDGYGDLAVGAPGYSSSAGRVNIYSGNATGVTSPAVQYMIGLAGELAGTSVAAGGDVNADGYRDLLVGAPGYYSNAGSMYVYYGTGAGLDMTLPDSPIGEYVGDYYGWRVANAGDVNQDGSDDVLTTAPDANGSTGRAYINLGSPAGIIFASNSVLDGTEPLAWFGYAAAGIGDVNQDGSGDFVVGAPGTSAYTGSVYVYQGEIDDDGDGYSSSQDCDDTDAAIHPGALDIQGDGIDADCDGGEICYMDADGDNFRPDRVSTVASSDADCTDPGEALRTDATGDCDDSDISINPAVAEILGDGIDQDCDTVEWCYADLDDDGYLVNTSAYVTSTDLDCLDAGEGVVGDPVGDCNDRIASVSPGAVETIGNEADEDCDGLEVCYVDLDGDRVRPDDLTTVVSADTDCRDAGEAADDSFSGDCNDANGAINPRASEVVGDQVDQNCDGDELCHVDADDDGFRPNVTSTVLSVDDIDCLDAGEATSSDSVGDCDDADPNVGPGGAEIVGDGIDQDCDGGDECYVDTDGDGYRTDATVRSADLDCLDRGEGTPADPNTDCDDAASNVHPDALEVADDAIDENCDGLEACFADVDDDGYLPDHSTLVVSADLDCADAGEGQSFDSGGDCNEADAAINPGATEVLGDGIDQNCDGGEICYADADADGYREGSGTVVRSIDADCTDTGEAAATAAGGDCNDTDAAINPAATEVIGDSIDEDCDRQEICYADADNDGFRPDDGATVVSTDRDCLDRGEAGADDVTGDCNDASGRYFPGAREADCTNPNDYNCDGSVGYADADLDGYAACRECDDGVAAVNPGAAEVCNGIDDDCDGDVDPPRSTDASTWYRDSDGDGYTAQGGSITSCDEPEGYFSASESFDCDDAHAGTNPGATDYLNDGIDQDCSGTADDPPPVDDTGVKDDYQACGCSTEGSGQGAPAAAVLLGIVGLSLARRRPQGASPLR